ncbi:MAG: tetratricopeptide repeat protein [Bacteroidetes bacterium]|nr:MAG: tetratricopeptide repeat protein [Bacteroidota bacterium]
MGRQVAEKLLAYFCFTFFVCSFAPLKYLYMARLFALFLLFLPFVAFSQKPNPKIDSLEKVLKTAKDTNKVNTYMELARTLFASNPDKALKYAEVAQKEAGMIQYKKGEADALTAMSVISVQKGNTNMGFEYQNKALTIYKHINYKKGIGTGLNNLGRIYMEKNNYPIALEYFQKSLKIREEIKDEKGILSCLNNIGGTYTFQANENKESKELYKKAREYYTRGLPIAKKTKNEALEASLLNNIGATYDEQEEYEKALRYYGMALAIYERTHNKFYLASSYHYIGNLYWKQKDFVKAKDYQLKSLQIAEEVKDKNGIAKAKYGLASVYVEENRLADAMKEILPTVAIFKETGARDDLAKSKRFLAELYEKAGDFKSAHQTYKEASLLKDSIFNTENSKHMAGLQESFAVAQKEKEIQVQAEKQKASEARQKLTNYTLIAVVLVLGLVVVLLVFVYRSLTQTKKLNNQINKQVVQLQEQREEINTQNEELHQSREEIMAQRDALSQTNEMIVKEQAKSDSLLLNILPMQVAEELKEKGSATAQHYKKATVLFTDFQGFTKRTAGMTPQEVIAELNQCFSKFDAIIDKYNLEKIKTIGDAYMCAGGLPTPNDTNPIDAVRAGLAMQQYMEAYRAECEAKGEPYFRCRLGINTGEVVAGVVGTKKFAYDIWGDTVNTASRAESGGEVGMVNITQSTYEEVKDYFECEYRGEIEVKGKGQIKMYFVLREKQA